MAHVVDTSIAAVKISGGSFSVPDFSSSEEEGEDVTIPPVDLQGRRRSNAILNAQPANNDTLSTSSQRRSGNSASNSGLGDAVGSFSDTSCKTESQSSPSSYTTALSSPQMTLSASDVISNNNCGGSPEQRDCKDDSQTPVGAQASHHDHDDGVKHSTRKAERGSHRETRKIDSERNQSLVKSTSATNGEAEKRSSSSSHEGKSVTSPPVMKAWDSVHDSISTTSTQSTSSGGENATHSTKEAFFQSRFNPFDRDIHMEEDHFSDNPDGHFFGRDSSSPASALSSHSSGLEGGSLARDSDKVTFAELGLTEDHFSHPEVGGHFGFSKTEELQSAIEQCKALISKAQPHSDRQKNLVQKLVELRLKLQELKEPEEHEENVVQALGHRLMRKEGRSTKYYCEKCNNIIWGVVQEWRKCLDCGYKCHDKCVPLITRNCAMVKVKENPVLLMEICPRNPKGLMAQDYRCAECKAQIPVGDGVEPRLCEYNGRYYCDLCHWNDLMYVPAQILLNWDFEKYKVCRASKQFLKLMTKKAVIKVKDINHSLFNYVEQLNDIKNLREELLLMKKYILACPSAMQSKLLLQLSSRPHFVECSDRYSLQDLLDSDDKLVPDLVQVHSQWAQHIKTDCELCQGRGYFCELCTSKEVLFPFDNIAVVCPSCSSVMHRICFAQQVKCPKCERRRQRQAESGPSKS